MVAGLVMTGLSTAAPATAAGQEVGGSGDTYFLSDSFSATANVEFSYGLASDQVYVGDWDGNGTDTLALRRGATFYIKNSNAGGNADQVVTYGRPGDVVLVGDWDGNGTDTFAVRRGAEYHVKNSLAGGPADHRAVYGRAGDAILVGDWDGDGKDTFAVRRGSEYHVKNSISAGRADQVAVYGRANDDVYVGDFDGDGDDSFTVRRGATYFVANAIRPGSADRTVVFGRTTDTTLVGDWNGDRTDTLGLRRASTVQHIRGAVSGAQEAYDAKMVGLINGERARNGVPPLAYWPPLRGGALSHSSWMARTDSFQHATSRTLWDDAAGAGCPSGYAENIFWSSYASKPEQAMQRYMASPGHRANILNPQLGFVATGTVLVGGELYNTQRFGYTCR
ncbi:CAP domain-containing protein [Georgenia yuyongxinii]|uniref:CAP domain-containing protein n=1 Tax=Georgenia yuyongxinii TaxID=2589797 RepID=A0A552WLQ1_9MICO|nr:CAP domain-containing protein [Georgenia yuyongxinii]TRW43594.1 CAP domain-containing protein [Georgenia yuyongxinii]